MDFLVSGWQWLVAQFDSIGAGIITTVLIALFLMVCKVLYKFINRLMPLTLTEYKLLNGVRTIIPPTEISVTTYNKIVAGTYSPDESETPECLKAIAKLKRKGAIKNGNNGNNSIIEESYIMTKYGRKRLKRYEIAMNAKQVLKPENLKQVWNSAKDESSRK
ncbi:hypothetical protein ACS85_21200 [Vibrio parahaemolyticus]|uniref:hypothetical protein n=1 Tax=Vibrio parahaemolyticus TaxID=670 RepID=UPI0006A707BB|nr:hypothetical protein [Vibrio parahaemolyticus]EIZ1368839.1 hypothetical protein [Vibrio parahaemolyticus]EKO5224352.1 hypothetical protein [Vibrio parahaemolyticus]KOE09122.1 hypothetical protein ACS85_21200 [Vibrio parahaemolyticus]